MMQKYSISKSNNKPLAGMVPYLVESQKVG